MKLISLLQEPLHKRSVTAALTCNGGLGMATMLSIIWPLTENNSLNTIHFDRLGFELLREADEKKRRRRPIFSEGTQRNSANGKNGSTPYRTMSSTACIVTTNGRFFVL